MPDSSRIARVAHNLGLATWFGGSLFGQVALNPTINKISSRQERGRVLNESWARFNAVNTLALTATAVSWRLGGLLEADGKPGVRERGLASAKNFLLGGALLTGAGAGILGARVAGQAPQDAPEGGTPVESGTEPAPETPQEAATSQRLIGVLGSSSLSLLAGAIWISAILDARARERSRRGILSRLFL